jgi:hypothetical protein
MSIFKQSFKKFVSDQFAVRQKVVAKGNSGQKDVFRRGAVTGNNGELGDKGAYYAYAQKQCVIRMASLVDLVRDIDLEFAGDDFPTYKGSTFARNFILEGGILSDYARNTGTGPDGQQVKVRKLDVRGGFPNARGATGARKRVNLSYGDPSLASDPDSDGYGVVPMPGITSANIRTKSAYGSLREAKVNFICHNLRQLEILELLYMRPGYPVFMEWGWSPFILNDGTIENQFPSIIDRNIFWSDTQITQEYLQTEVVKLKGETNGNYDGFLGFCTNFDYSVREDGGFDCSTELISMGEVIDSLKVSPEYNIGLEELASFTGEVIGEDPSEEGEETEKITKENIFHTSLGRILTDLLLVTDEEGVEIRTNDYDLNYFSKEILQGDWDNAFNSDISSGRLQQQLRGIWKGLIDILGPEAVAQGIIPKGTVLQKGPATGDIIVKTNSFIRWDLMIELINTRVIPRTEKDQLPFMFSPYQFTSNQDGTFNFEPILYTSYENRNGNIKDVSCNGKIVILPHQFDDFYDSEAQIGFWGRAGAGLATIVLAGAGLIAYGINSLANLFGAEISEEDNRDLSFGEAARAARTFTTGEYQQQLNSAGKPIGSTIEIKPEFAERTIGNIFIGVEHMVDIYKQTFNDKDATLGDFISNLWESINDVCPMHNFGLRNDFERPHILQVIDLPISTGDLESVPYKDLFKFNVLSNDSIVRNFKISTAVPNALKATIAINAQAAAGSDDLDSVTFAAFNRNIKSRLHSLSEKFSENERIRYNNIYKRRLKSHQRLGELYSMIRDYNRQFFNVLEGEVVNDDLLSIFDSIKTIIKEVQTLEIYLEKSRSGYLKNQAIIPFDLNLEVDGISGVIIGNVFRIDESRLPRDYRKNNVAFIALGEEQTITVGQDWTTKIKGQIVLYPTQEEIASKGVGRPAVVDNTNVNFVGLYDTPAKRDEGGRVEDDEPQDQFADDLTEEQERLFQEYNKLNRKYSAYKKRYDQLYYDTEWSSGNASRTIFLNELRDKMIALIDPFEALLPQIESAFGESWRDRSRIPDPNQTEYPEEQRDRIYLSVFMRNFYAREADKYVKYQDGENGPIIRYPVEQPYLNKGFGINNIIGTIGDAEVE